MDSYEKLRREIPQFKVFHEFIKSSLKGDYTYGSLICGGSGLGKSQFIADTVRDSGAEYVFFNTYTTPLSLYETLFYGKNKIVILDDMANLFENPISVSILKSAIFTIQEKRTVSWGSTAAILEKRELPQSFDFEGRIIIITNELPTYVRETFSALLNRMYVYTLTLTIQDRIKLISIILKDSDLGISDDRKTSIINWIKSKIGFCNYTKVNARTALRIAELVRIYGSIRKVEELVNEILEVDRKAFLFETIEGQGKEKKLSVKQRIEVWKETTGYSRTEYFRVKERYYNACYNKYVILGKDRCEINDIVSNINIT